MKAGRNFVTSGPLVRFTIGTHEVGDVVPAVAGKLTAKIEAWDDALDKVELIRNGEVVRSWDANGAAFTTTTAEVGADATAWYIARVYGRNPDHIAITNPIYFDGPDYRAPQPAPARVTGNIRDAATGAALNGIVEVIRMDGRIPVKVSEIPATGGRFEITVPATARLRLRVAGYAPVLKSVFMDSPSLLDPMLNITPEQISDWATYERIREELGRVMLEFLMRREAPKADEPRTK
jgi:hypothetical protein